MKFEVGSIIVYPFFNQYYKVLYVAGNGIRVLYLDKYNRRYESTFISNANLEAFNFRLATKAEIVLYVKNKV